MFEQRQISIPPRAHPLARALFARMAKTGTTYARLAAQSGVKVSTFKAFRHSNTPGTDSIQATLNAVGRQAIPVPQLNILPLPLAADLEALGKRHGIPTPVAELAIVAAARAQNEGQHP